MWILKNSKDLLDNLKSSDSLPEGMFKEVMNDLWLARISSLLNEVGLYVVLLEVLLFMPNPDTINHPHIHQLVKDKVKVLGIWFGNDHINTNWIQF
jgi:hypothetical protein